jgi:hypothetical protein
VVPVSAADDLAALKAATREAHEVLSDLRAERRAMQDVIAGLGPLVERLVGGRIETEVREQMAKLGKATEKAMRDSVAKVGREFDRLQFILTGQEDDARPPLEQQLRQVQGTPLGEAAKVRAARARKATR